MTYTWKTSPAEVEKAVTGIEEQIKGILKENVTGVYLHGSLAMGGFQPDTSDIDMIVVTEKPLAYQMKKELLDYLLATSGQPFPIEIHFLNKEQIKKWEHPCPYDFHYSEYWRERYEEDAGRYLNEADLKDSDLAAHITILHRRGICLEGPSVEEIFPPVPQNDYLSSILADYQECLANLEKDPKYCVVNMLRVYWYRKAGIITSKQEACEWAVNTLPKMIAETVQKVMEDKRPEKNELLEFKDYIDNKLNN